MIIKSLLFTLSLSTLVTAAERSILIDAKSITGVSVGYFNDNIVTPVLFEGKDGAIYEGEVKNIDPSTGHLSARVISKCQNGKCVRVNGSVFGDGFYGLKAKTHMPENAMLLNQYTSLSVKLIHDATDHNSSSALQTYMQDMMSKTQPVLIAEPQEVKLFVKE